MVQYVPVHCCCTNWQVEAFPWSPCLTLSCRQWCSPRLLSLCVNFIRNTFFVENNHFFFCHFFIAQTMRNLTGCYTNIKPHCCSLSNIKTLVLSCIEQILITIEYYSDIDIWYLCYNFDIKLLSFIFLMIWPEAFRGLLGQQWFLDLPLVLVI